MRMSQVIVVKKSSRNVFDWWLEVRWSSTVCKCVNLFCNRTFRLVVLEHVHRSVSRSQAPALSFLSLFFRYSQSLQLYTRNFEDLLRWGGSIWRFTFVVKQKKGAGKTRMPEACMLVFGLMQMNKKRIYKGSG